MVWGKLSWGRRITFDGIDDFELHPFSLMLQLIIDWLCVAEPHLDNDITITDAARHSIPFFLGGGKRNQQLNVMERDNITQSVCVSCFSLNLQCSLYVLSDGCAYKCLS